MNAINTDGRGIVSESESAYAKPLHREARALYDDLKDCVSAWPGVQTGAVKNYLKFACQSSPDARSRNFAEMRAGPEGLHVWVRREVFANEAGDHASYRGLVVRHMSDRHIVNQKFTMVRRSDIAGAVELLSRSYSAVQR